MEFTNIIPNGPYGQLIKNKPFISFLTRTINMAYNIKGDNSYPAPQPVSIEKKDFEKLKNFQYNVTLKLDGTRFLLFFMLDKHNNKQTILVNRALNFYNINIECDSNLFEGQGTLLDGELLFKNNKWTFSIHDGLYLCGNKIVRNTHFNRLSDIKCALELYVSNINSNTFYIETKLFYDFKDINDFINNIYLDPDNLKLSDGIILMPNKLPVVSGTQYSMFKWKPDDKHTFDFQINESENSDMVVKVYHLNKLIDFANIKYLTEQGKEFIDKLKSLDNYSNDCIVECYFNKDKQNFTPFLIRTDKTHPNSLRTIERTLFNIKEDISIDDFKNI